MLGQKCVATTKKGKKCWAMAELMVGGLAVCHYHIGYASRLWKEVKNSLPSDIRESAERDTREVNINIKRR